MFKKIKTFLYPSIITLFFLALYVFAWNNFKSNIVKEAQNEFEDEAQQTTNVIKGRLDRYALMLYGLQGLYNASVSVERNEFAAYAQGLDIENNYPGVSFISYSEGVLSANREEFVAKVKSDTSARPDGYPSYDIFPLSSEEKKEYFPVKYVYPESEANLKAFGFDISSESNRLDAIEKSRDSGVVTATSRILVKPDDSPGMWISLPIYRKGFPLSNASERRMAVVGYVLAGVRANDFFPAVFKEIEMENIDIEVFDGESNVSPSADNIFYDSDLSGLGIQLGIQTEEKEEDDFLGFIKSIPVEVSGRIWTVRFFFPQSNLFMIFGGALGVEILIAGILLAILIFFAFYSIFGSKQRATSLADEMIRKVELTKKKYEMLYEFSSDAIMTLEPPSWKFTSGNPATVKLFNAKDEAEFISLEPWELSPEKQPDGQLSEEKAKNMINEAMDKGSKFFEWTHKKHNGETFEAAVLLNKIKDKDKEYLQATVRDITQQKKAEAELINRTEESERANRLMVGRELEMIKLKKEIMELKKIKQKQ